MHPRSIPHSLRQHSLHLLWLYRLLCAIAADLIADVFAVCVSFLVVPLWRDSQSWDFSKLYVYFFSPPNAYLLHVRLFRRPSSVSVFSIAPVPFSRCAPPSASLAIGRHRQNVTAQPKIRDIPRWNSPSFLPSVVFLPFSRTGTHAGHASSPGKEEIRGKDNYIGGIASLILLPDRRQYPRTFEVFLLSYLLTVTEGLKKR